jgi:hypothetical protein
MSCVYSTSPQDYEDQLNALKTSYACNMNTFKEYYVLTKQYPEDDEYAKGYESTKSNLLELSKKLFLLNNIIEKELVDMQVQSDETLDIIDQNVTNRSALNEKLNFFTGEVRGAQQLASDFKANYTRQYLANWSMFIGVIISSATLFYTFRKMESE